jgi:glutamyl-tRNA synthetase
VVRIEDIDTPRVVRGSAARITEDLTWLGLDWDGPLVVQSERHALYEAALAKLEAAGLTYLCDCSRKEIALAASAPHSAPAGSEESIYPGTCRDKPQDRSFKRSPAIRLRVPEGEPGRITFEDLAKGRIEDDVAANAGDFVLRRGDGVFAYQLVVAIDDAEAGITHVVRADDLLASTGRQLLLLRLLGYAHAPAYVHIPLVVAPDGERLAKRAGSVTIRHLAERGLTAKTLVTALARGLGLVDGGVGELTTTAVAGALRPPDAWRKTPWPIPSEWG